MKHGVCNEDSQEYLKQFLSVSECVGEPAPLTVAEAEYLCSYQTRWWLWALELSCSSHVPSVL